MLVSATPSWALITVSSNNAGGNGLLITSSTGINMPTGTRIRVGSFNDPVGNAAILTGNDFNAIDSIFRPLGEGAAGGGTVAAGQSLAIGAVAGRFNFSVGGITQAYLPAGVPLFVWALGGQTVGPSGEWAIVTNNDSGGVPAGSPWTAPVDDPDLGGTITLAVTNQRVDDANDVVKGTLQAAGPPQLRLAVIPEPGSLALLGLAFGCIRRRRK